MDLTMRITGTAIAGLALTALSACSTEPRYRTYHVYTAPDSIQGRQCTVQCQTNRLLCEQNAQLKEQRCQRREAQKYRDAVRHANRVYADCARQMRARYGPHYTKYLPACEYRRSNAMPTRNGNPCTIKLSCTSHYRRCFRSCGGRIDALTRCVANCNHTRK